MEWEFLDIANNFRSGIDIPQESEFSYYIVVSDNQVLSIDGVHPWRPLNQDEWRWLGLDAESEHFLGDVDGVPIYACQVDPQADHPEGYEFESLYSFLGQVEEPVFNLIGRAKQVVDWYRNHQYCGVCGDRTTVSGNDRSMKCEKCNQMFYPRLSPSIIVLITRGEELLLAKNSRARGNFYSTLAGFVEPGESIEAAVHREVFEEVGITIKNLIYYGSQSWPFPNSLMLGFHAEYASGEFQLQQEEIADARWFHYRDLPHHPAMVSIAGRLINDTIERLASADDGG